MEVTISIFSLSALIHDAHSVLLTTHRQCDGDGLGAQLGLFHALKKAGKDVRILNVDATPKKYHFLNTESYVEEFEGKHTPLPNPTSDQSIDLAIILDTNDRRLIEPLYSELEKTCKKIVFIDHHPVLENGPAPTKDSYIDTAAASTGEISFKLINALDIELDKNICEAIYTSIVFDTQIFRYIRNSPNSHLIAAELLKYDIKPEKVHQYLFASHSVEKIKFLSKALEKIEYYQDNKIAILKLEKEDMNMHKISSEDSRDLIDMIMNIDTLVAGAMIREEDSGAYKLSIRSKGQIEVRSIAEEFDGGGHLFASGATINTPYEEIKQKLVDSLTAAVTTLPK